MKTLIQTIMGRDPARWDAVLVIGAGSGSSLALLRQREPARMLLVEPHPDQAEMLARTIDAGRGEEVRALAIAATGGEVTLRQCSNARFNSFGTPAGRTALLPNLRDTGELRVPAMSLGGLATAAGLDPAGRNLLVVEAPGQLAPLLEAPDQLQMFSALIVKTGEVPLFEGDPTPAGLHEILVEAGFDPAGSDPEAIYPVAVLGFERNDARLENRRLRDRVEAAERGLGEQVERAARREADAARHASDHRATVETLQQQVQALKSEADDVRSGHARELAVLTDSRDRAAQALADLEKAAATAAAEHARQIADQQAQLDHAREEAAAARKELDALRATHAATRKELDDLRAAHSAQVAQLTRDCDQQAQAAVQATGEVERLTGALAVQRDSYESKLEEALARLESEGKSAAMARDAFDKANAELAQYRAGLEKTEALVAELRKSGEELNAAHDKARRECAEQAKALQDTKASLQKSMLQSQERGARLMEMERDIARARQQQAWLDREMAKAEGQLELIRDLVAKDK